MSGHTLGAGARDPRYWPRLGAATWRLLAAIGALLVAVFFGWLPARRPSPVVVVADEPDEPVSYFDRLDRIGREYRG